jgi:hypothetical protein
MYYCNSVIGFISSLDRYIQLSYFRLSKEDRLFSPKASRRYIQYMDKSILREQNKFHNAFLLHRHYNTRCCIYQSSTQRRSTVGKLMR